MNDPLKTEEYKPDCRYKITTFATVQQREIDWLWPNFLAAGKVVLVGGDAGMGKTSLLLDWAARITSGGTWPDGTEAPIGDVLLLTYEDDIADTLLPRFLLCGGDPQRMHTLDRIKEFDEQSKEERVRLFRLSEDVEILREILTDRPQIRLIEIDPVNGYFGSGHDSFRDNEVRDVIRPYIELARDFGICIVLNTHFTKRQGPVLHRFMGSVGFVGIVRVALAVMKDTNEPERRVILPAKNNIGDDSIGFAYRLTGVQPGVCRPEYEREPLDISAQEFADDHAEVKVTKVEAAMEWLAGLLADGPVERNEILRKAKLAGHRERTLERAKPRVGVICYPDRGGSYWRLK